VVVNVTEIQVNFGLPLVVRGALSAAPRGIVGWAVRQARRVLREEEPEARTEEAKRAA
jgi:hypothetical protein